MFQGISPKKKVREKKREKQKTKNKKHGVTKLLQVRPPVNVRGVGESHEIVKQTDSGLGIDARESLGSPLSSEALLNSSLPHDLVMGGISRGGSRHICSLTKNQLGSLL